MKHSKTTARNFMKLILKTKRHDTECHVAFRKVGKNHALVVTRGNNAQSRLKNMEWPFAGNAEAIVDTRVKLRGMKLLVLTERDCHVKLKVAARNYFRTIFDVRPVWTEVVHEEASSPAGNSHGHRADDQVEFGSDGLEISGISDQELADAQELAVRDGVADDGDDTRDEESAALTSAEKRFSALDAGSPASSKPSPDIAPDDGTPELTEANRVTRDVLAAALSQLDRKEFEFYASSEKIEQVVEHERRKAEQNNVSPDWHRLENVCLAQFKAKDRLHHWLGIDEIKVDRLIANDKSFATKLVSQWLATYRDAEALAQQVKNLLDDGLVSTGLQSVVQLDGTWERFDGMLRSIGEVDLSPLEGIFESGVEERIRAASIVLKNISDAIERLQSDDITVIDESPMEHAPHNIIDTLSLGLIELNCSVRRLATAY